MCVYASYMYVATASKTLHELKLNLLKNLNFVYRVAWTTCAYTQRAPDISPPYSLPTLPSPAVPTVVPVPFCEICRPAVCRPARSWGRNLGSPMSCGKFSLPATSHLGCPISCGKFVFPSHYLPLPILDVPSPVVSSSSHLISCHFPSWTWQIHLPISVPATSHLGRPISCGKLSSHLIACHFPCWTSHLLW